MRAALPLWVPACAGMTWGVVGVTCLLEDLV